jgi:hypothetical protein
MWWKAGVKGSLETMNGHLPHVWQRGRLDQHRERLKHQTWKDKFLDKTFRNVDT